MALTDARTFIGCETIPESLHNSAYRACDPLESFKVVRLTAPYAEFSRLAYGRREDTRFLVSEMILNG
jgi:hypothetical protein